MVCSHQIRPDLPLLSSEKNRGDASSFVQNIICDQNVYSSPDSSKWESYKSNAKKAVLQNLDQICKRHVEKTLVEKSDKILADKNCETYIVDHIQLTASRLSKSVKDVLQKRCSAKSC